MSENVFKVKCHAPPERSIYARVRGSWFDLRQYAQSYFRVDRDQLSFTYVTENLAEAELSIDLAWNGPSDHEAGMLARHLVVRVRAPGGEWGPWCRAEEACT